ncbi:hypothetical protein Angca_001216, partial [Angiostrongylus cantonensis]
MCVDNPPCLLSPGREVLDFSFDSTRPFTHLFRKVHKKVSAYQVVVRLRNNGDSRKDLLSLTVQVRI